MVTSLFSYRKAHTFLHRANASVKLLLLILLSSLVFFKFTNADLTVSTIENFPELFSTRSFPEHISTLAPALVPVSIFFLTFVLFIITRIPWQKMVQLKFVLLLGFFYAIFKSISFDVTLHPSVAFCFSFSLQEGLDGLLWGFKFFTASFLALIFFDSTSIVDLQDSFNAIQKKVFFFSPRLQSVPFSLYLGLVISFVPEVFLVWGQIKKASMARSMPPRSMPAQQNKRSKIKVQRRLAIFVQEFSTLVSLLLLRALEKRKALINRT